ncbi:hypothetical protein MMC11_007753 [Xylographa trunciseda]|nr:hypothetical protein [Xylographa trunciseda]
MSDMKSAVPPYQEHPDVAQQPQQFYPQDTSMQNNQGAIPPQGQQMYGNEMKQVPGGMMPRQQVQYQNATPLQSVGPGPTPVDCPACGTRTLTRVQYESGNTT